MTPSVQVVERGVIRRQVWTLAAMCLGSIGSRVHDLGHVILGASGDMLDRLPAIPDDESDVEDMIERVARSRGADPVVLRRAIAGIRGRNGYGPPPGRLHAAPAMPEDTLDEGQLVEIVLDEGQAEGRRFGGMISPLRSAALDVLDLLRLRDAERMDTRDAEVAAMVQQRADEAHGEVSAGDLGAVVRTVRRAVSRDTPRNGG